jgi:hypothetical protein
MVAFEHGNWIRLETPNQNVQIAESRPGDLLGKSDGDRSATVSYRISSEECGCLTYKLGTRSLPCQNVKSLDKAGDIQPITHGIRQFSAAVTRESLTRWLDYEDASWLTSVLRLRCKTACPQPPLVTEVVPRSVHLGSEFFTNFYISACVHVLVAFNDRNIAELNK